jgi:hypothetical protein
MKSHKQQNTCYEKRGLFIFHWYRKENAEADSEHDPLYEPERFVCAFKSYVFHRFER